MHYIKDEVYSIKKYRILQLTPVMIVRPAATADAKIAEPKDQKEDAMR